jgi:hypothetical protein
MYNQNAFITVLMDKKTKNYLSKNNNTYEAIVTETQVIDVPEILNQKESSRWIKTSIGNIVSGDFLFIDCDTIICDKLDCVFSNEIITGAVLDTHVPLSKHYLEKEFKNDNKLLGFTAPFESDFYFNGGLLFCRDTPQAKIFFEKWHLLWNKSKEMGNSQDMPSLNQANFEMGNIIKELDGIWNCQISNNGLPFLNNAKIIHYYATSILSFQSPYLLASMDILAGIHKEGNISDELLTLLQNPKSAFAYNSRIISDNVLLDIFGSAFFSKLLWLRRKHEKIFWKLNSILDKIKKPGFKKNAT